MSDNKPIGICKEHGPYYAHFMQRGGSPGLPGCPVCARIEYNEYCRKKDAEDSVRKRKRNLVVWPIVLLGLVAGLLVGGFGYVLLGLLLGALAAKIVASRL